MLRACRGAAASQCAPACRAEPGRLVHGLGLPPAWSSDRLCWFATRALSPALSRLLPADVVHETYVCPKPYLTRARRRVTTMFDMIHEIYWPGHFTTAHKRASIARCDHIICISHATRADLCERLDVAPERTSVVHLGYLDCSGLDAAGAPAEFASGLAPERTGELRGAPYFLYVGQRGDYKNFASLLRAWATASDLVRDVRLVCFGGGPFTTDELALATSLGLDDRRLLQTGGSDAALAAAYRHAVALVYPSLYEGFGLPPLEAMSAGCPVLCSDTSSLPEVVGDAAITFAPRDIEAIRAAMRHVAYSADVRHDLVQRGHARRRQFSWQRCASETLAVYRRLN